MRLRVTAVSLFVRRCVTRLPFRFGSTTLTEAPLVLAHVEAAIGGGAPLSGYASDLLVSKWFDKDPRKTRNEEIADLLDAVDAAAHAYARRSATAGSLFELWHAVDRERATAAGPDPSRRLVHG